MKDEEELKTLKDLKKYLNHDMIQVNTEELKAEAIKWVKGFRERIEDYEGTRDWETQDKLGALMGFCINFFNLTEEDLK
jgi:hypothetical protein